MSIITIEDIEFEFDQRESVDFYEPVGEKNWFIIHDKVTKCFELAVFDERWLFGGRFDTINGAVIAAL